MCLQPSGSSLLRTRSRLQQERVGATAWSPPLTRIVSQNRTPATTQEQATELMASSKELRFGTFITQIASPFDEETTQHFTSEIKPIVDCPYPALCAVARLVVRDSDAPKEVRTNFKAI